MDNKKRPSLERWVLYCILIAVLLLVIPVIVGGLGLIATFFIPLLLIALPIMVFAWICVILF